MQFFNYHNVIHDKRESSLYGNLRELQQKEYLYFLEYCYSPLDMDITSSYSEGCLSLYNLPTKEVIRVLESVEFDEICGLVSKFK